MSPFHVAQGLTYWLFGSRLRRQRARYCEADLFGGVYVFAAIAMSAITLGLLVQRFRNARRMSDMKDTRQLIELADVSRWYGNVVAVNDVSFTIGAGINGLLGPNGAGKSTILHMISGFLRPSAGTVTVEGLPPTDHEALYEMTGIVPEREAVYPFLTGYEFVLLNAKLHKLTDPEAATRRALQAVGMEFAEERKCGGYSKGMKQRIKVAAAIVHDPRVLLSGRAVQRHGPRPTAALDGPAASDGRRGPDDRLLIPHSG